MHQFKSLSQWFTLRLKSLFRIQIAIPVTNEYPYYDQCYRKDLDFKEILKSSKDPRSSEFQTNRTVECTQWEYNFTQIPYSSIGTEVKYLILFSKFDLILFQSISILWILFLSLKKIFLSWY